MKKILSMAIIALIIISALIGLSAYWKFRHNLQLLREQAICVAQEYLEEKYEEKMTCVKVECYYDKMIWGITFSPNSDPEQRFTVSLIESKDTSIPISERFRVDAEW